MKSNLMIHKKYIYIFVILLFSNIFGQIRPNYHTAGPSVGFSFLGTTYQLGINHEYGIQLNDLGINKPGIIGVGGIFRYWSYSETFPTVEWDYSNLLIGMQFNYHFILNNQFLDPWAGLVLAYDFRTSKNKIILPNVNIDNSNNSSLWIGAQAGLRYWLNERMALNFRLGFGTLSYGALDIGFEYTLE